MTIADAGRRHAADDPSVSAAYHAPALSASSPPRSRRMADSRFPSPPGQGCVPPPGPDGDGWVHVHATAPGALTVDAERRVPTCAGLGLAEGLSGVGRQSERGGGEGPRLRLRQVAGCDEAVQDVLLALLGEV